MKVSVNGSMRKLPPQMPNEKPKTPEQAFRYAIYWGLSGMLVNLLFSLAALILKSKGL